MTKSKSAQKCVRMHCSLQFCSLLPFEFKNTSCGFQALRKPGLNRAGGSCLSSRSCLLHQQLRSPMQSTAMTTITVHQSLDAIDERTCSSCNLLVLKHAWRADSFALASPRAPAWQDTFAMIRGPAAVCCISLVGTQLPWMKTSSMGTLILGMSTSSWCCAAHLTRKCLLIACTASWITRSPVADTF